MRWLITLLLAILVAGGGAMLLFGDKILPAIGLADGAPMTSPAVTDLANVPGDTLRRLEITPPDQPTATFERAKGVWLPTGGWDVRQEELNDLLATLTSLRTRFQAQPLNGNEKDFGLAPEQKPWRVALSTGERTRVLVFGRPSTTGPEFDRPAFVKVDDGTDVIQVGPEVFALVARPTEIYLRKQVFSETARARFNDPPTPGQPQLASEARKPYFDDRVKTIEISGPDGKYTLLRTKPTPSPRRDPATRSAEPAMLPTELAEAWVLTAPTEDRIDPLKLKSILTALPDLWVERFLDPGQLADIAADFFRTGGLPPIPAGFLQSGERAELREALYAELTGFTREAIDKRKKDIEAKRISASVKTFPVERIVTISFTDRTKAPITLRIGSVSRVTTRKEMGPPMGMFPPQEREVRTEYRYAKFEGNPRVFEIKGDKLSEIFVKPEELADPKLAHFSADEVNALTVTVPKTLLAAAAPFAAISDRPLSQVVITRVKGKPTASSEKGKKDRWFLGRPPTGEESANWFVGRPQAEATEITALVEALSKLEAKLAEDRLHAVELPGLPVTVTIEVEPKVSEGDDPLPKKTFTYQLGGRKGAEGPLPPDVPPAAKLAVKMNGWARLNWVDLSTYSMAPPSGPAADELALRPQSVYRSKQLFDTADSTLDQLATVRDSAPFTAVAPAALGGVYGVAPISPPSSFTAKLPTNESKWSLVTPVDTPADDAAMPKLIKDLTDLKFTREIAVSTDSAQEQKQLRDFGLLPPALVVKLGFRGAEARTETLEVGIGVPGEDDVYARLNGRGAVFTVPKALAESLASGAEALLPRQPWAITAEAITTISVKRGRASEDTYTLTKLDPATRTWALAGPFAVTADGPQAEALATAAAGLKAVRYEPINSPLQLRTKYGLVEPAIRLGITTRIDGKTATQTLLIGNRVSPNEPEWYAKLEAPAAPVFVIAEALPAVTDKSAVAYLDRKLLVADASKLLRLQLAGPTRDSDVILATDGKSWKPEGANFPVDEPTVSALANAAMQLNVLRMTGYGPATSAEALASAAGPWVGTQGFGFVSHSLTLTIAGEAAPIQVQLGRELPSGERYVRIANRPAEGVVSSFTAAMLGRGKLDVIDRNLFNFDPLLLTSLTRKMGAEEMELAPAGRGWEVTKPKKFKADKPTVEALAGEVATLRAKQVVAFGPPTPNSYGLEKPAAVLNFVVDGKTQTLTLGNRVPDAEGKPTEDRYATVSGSQVVAVLPAALVNKLLAEAVKFSDRTLNPNRFVDADKVVVSRDGRTVTFEKKSGVWKMTAPADAPAETADLEDLIAVAAQLRADELLANDPPAPKLKELGFDPPEGRIVISDGGKEVLNLLIGAREKTGPRVPVKLEKSTLIGLLDAATSAKVTSEFRTRAAWTALDAAQIETLAVSGSSNFALRKKDATSWVDPTNPGANIDPDKIANTLATLANLKAERYIADQDAKLALYGLDQPSRVIVVMLKGGDRRVLHLGNPVGGPTGKQIYAKVEDKGRTDVFVLSEADTKLLTQDRKFYGR